MIVLLIIIVAFIAFVGWLSADSDRKKTVKMEKEKAESDALFRKEYGCSLDEAKQRIKTSSAIERIAKQIKNLRNPPSCFVVTRTGIMESDDPYALGCKTYYFATFGLADLPWNRECIEIFEIELEKQLQCSAPNNNTYVSYKRIKKGDTGYIFVQESRLKQSKDAPMKGW